MFCFLELNIGVQDTKKSTDLPASAADFAGVGDEVLKSYKGTHSDVEIPTQIVNNLSEANESLATDPLELFENSITVLEPKEQVSDSEVSSEVISQEGPTDQEKLETLAVSACWQLRMEIRSIDSPMEDSEGALKKMAVISNYGVDQAKKTGTYAGKAAALSGAQYMTDQVLRVGVSTALAAAASSSSSAISSSAAIFSSATSSVPVLGGVVSAGFELAKNHDVARAGAIGTASVAGGTAGAAIGGTVGALTGFGVGAPIGALVGGTIGGFLTTTAIGQSYPVDNDLKERRRRKIKDFVYKRAGV